MDRFYENIGEIPKILISLAIMLLAGFLMTRITKLLKLPNVSAYIISGILIGPFCFNLIPSEIIVHMEFIKDLALAFIAFGVGKFFKREVLKKAGFNIIIITVMEALLASVLIIFSMRFIFGFGWSFSLILGAIASATAPASTMMTIKQYKARGEFVDTLLQVVALDDIVCLLTFSIATAIASAEGSVAASDIVMPLVYNAIAIAIGVALGFILKFLEKKRSKDNRLIIVIMALVGLSGTCSALNISPLLACMVFSTIYINITDDAYLFHQIDNFTPPIMLLFFVLSGIGLDVSALATVGIAGVAYFVIRILGKYVGAFVGCNIAGKDKLVRNTLGLALIPQAGVAIGLAALGQRILPTEMGSMLSTIILASSVLYEFVGPACAKGALFLSGSIPPKEEPVSATPVVTPLEEIATSAAAGIAENISQSLEIRTEETLENPAEEVVNTIVAEQQNDHAINVNNGCTIVSAQNDAACAAEKDNNA
ncbi:MAG: cation:proton antiporter [Clostridia bacterium]|nr:cation:proton antiporter [Clostridia bacterium]